jgi:hypothetical protein
MIYKTIILSFFSITLLILGCQKNLIQDAYLNIESFPEIERQSKFSSYSVEEQIDIFLFAQIKGGKSDTYTRYLADNGQTKISAIVDAIGKNNDSLKKVDLIRSLELINMHCNCIKNDKKVISLLEKNKLQFKDDTDSDKTLREVYAEYLERIKNFSGF